MIRSWAFVAGLGLLSGCIGPPEYSSREFSGIVKDKATGAPIPGAVVIAVWKVSRSNFHGAASRVFHVSEAVTDEHGRYTLPAWGPKPRPSFWVLDVYDTSALVFKPGYELEDHVGHNIDDTGEIPPALRHESLLGPLAQELQGYAFVLSAISKAHCCDESQLESNPNLIWLLSQERRRLALAGLKEYQFGEIVDADKLTPLQQQTLEKGRKVPK